MKLSAVVVDFLSTISVSHSKNTVVAYHTDLIQLIHWLDMTFNVIESADLDPQHISAYNDHLKITYHSIRTIYRKVASMRHFLKYLEEQSQTTTPLVEHIKIQKPYSKTKQLRISKNVMHTLLESPQKNSPTRLRDSAILHILYSTGIKVTELCDLNLQSIDMSRKDKSIVIINIGGKKPRNIQINSQTIKVLADYLTQERPRFVAKAIENEQALFVGSNQPNRLTRKGICKIINTCAMQAGLKNISPTIIRNSKAYHMWENGASLQHIQRMLGHRSTTQTKRILSLYP